MLKNRQLIININNRSQKVFLKFCCFYIMILSLACKQDTSKNTSSLDETTAETEQESIENTSTKKIIFFGDSLTAGYGLEDVNEAFPGLIQNKIDALELDYSIVNSGVSGETTSGGKNRIDWVLNEEPAIFILELGANDGLRGVPLTETKANLQVIIDTVKKKYPNTVIVLAGMQIPPNMGQDYASEFKDLFPELAKKNDLYLIPFLLEDVGGIADLNQSDGIHPTKKGHKILAENVWNVLEPILK